MKVIDCVWERDNLDKTVVEVFVENKEIIDVNQLKSIETHCDYIVVKTQVLNPEQYRQLSIMGYFFIENQISISKKDFENYSFQNSEKYDSLLKCMQLTKVSSDTELQYVLTNMTEKMFVTDRIYLDKMFGAEYSIRRYKNWTRTEYTKGTCLYNIQYKSENVGFILFKLDNFCMTVLLWGLYEDYQRKGLGNLLPLSVYYVNNNITQLKDFQTKVSSNNKAVIDKFNNFAFRFSNFEYVFVKHLFNYE